MTDRTNHAGGSGVVRRSAVLLGVPIDDVTMDGAIELIVRFVGEGRETGRWHQVTTVNLDFVTNAVLDTRLLDLLQRTDLNLPDGMPIVWGARALGTPVRSRVAGVDLVDALAATSAATGVTVYLFGGAAGVAREACRRLASRHPGAKVVHGGDTPQFADVDGMDREVLAAIRAARPDVLCVGLGNPKQEWWIRRYGPELGVPVLIGVGGTFDFIVGRRRRAPAWMQRAGLEWVARALQEPARLGPRYARDAVVGGPRFVAQWWRQRRPGRAAPWRPVSIQSTGEGSVEIVAGPSLDLDRDGALGALVGQGVPSTQLDLSAIDHADAHTIRTLVSLRRTMGPSLEVHGLGPLLRRDLQRAGVLHLVLGDAAEDATGP